MHAGSFVPLTRDPDSTSVWLSAWLERPAGFDELIVSWNLDEVAASVVVEAQLRGHGGELPWLRLADWSFLGPRTSPSGQVDDGAPARVDVDVVRCRMQQTAFRVRVSEPGSALPPTPRLVGAAVALREQRAGHEESPRSGPAVRLDVPVYSQKLHDGTFVEWGGGGSSWCSPTCTAMVLAYWGAGPQSRELDWIDPETPQPAVVHAARHTHDVAYAGCGNWSFNVAYAACYGLTAYVTHLPSLAAAAELLAAGIPPVLSIACAAGTLEGAPYDHTHGHLLVLAGIDDRGDAIVNDPAAPSTETVRRVYRRDQLERAWLDGSGGIAYVISGAR